MEQLTVNDLYLQNKMNFALGRYNIIDCGIRTGKTYWAMKNLGKFTRDGKKNRVLFLVGTTALKSYIASEYEECVEVDDLWLQRSSWGEEQPDKIGIMCYQGFGARIIKDDIKFLDEIDVICWDECDSIFDFAVDAFTVARRTDFARKKCDNAEVLSIIQKYSSNLKYMPLVLLGAWEQIINERRIMCIGLSASPERAYAYYTSLTKASYEGRIDAGYRIAEDIYFHNLFNYLPTLKPLPNHGYWCYSPTIDGNVKIVAFAKRLGFRAIELHSEKNDKKPMTAEQKRVARMLEETGMIPPEYDFVVVTSAYMRGITIRDPRFDNVIIDSYRAEDRIQAPRQVHGYIRHLKAFAPEIPEEYLNRWVSVAECRELAKIMEIPGLDKQNRSRTMTWNKLKDYLPTIGYEVKNEKRRLEKGGGLTQCYYMSGKWHDVEVQDKGFLELVDARIAQLEDMED